MYKTGMTIKAGVVSAVLLGLTACGGGSGSGSGSGKASTGLPLYVQDAIDGPSYELTQAVKDTLAFMGNEERLAYDVYNGLHIRFPEVAPLDNIPKKSEYYHITAVQQLVQKYQLTDSDFTIVDMPGLGYRDTQIEYMESGTYDIAEIQSLYDTLMALGTDEIEALKVGCMVEVTDVDDLNRDIALAEASGASDVVTVFGYLRNGSYNHYWSFDADLKNRGVDEGCCVLGVIGGVDYCHPEYPQNENGRR